MINSKMWLVVKPTVGIPLFLGGVVVASLSVHTALLLNTAYFPAFLQGGQRVAASEASPAAPVSRAALLNSARVEAPADPGLQALKVSILAKQ
jgi:light-harvesting protein B-800-850 alpha chain